jgi:hypothetical protein
MSTGRAQLLLTLFNAFWIVIGLCVVTLAQAAYVNWNQAPQCFDYAEQKALPDREYLQFKDVTIASNKFRGHVCNFVDTRTGFPVLLEFDEGDVPYSGDTMQVMCMVVPFIGVGIIASIVYDRYVKRYLEPEKAAD